MRLLLQDKALRRRMGANARQRVIEVFDIGRVADTLESMFARPTAKRQGT
jgi:glycosyltransferase involved in cell wall biosynthesis